MAHRLSHASRLMPRDKRRSLCGWRAGGAASNVRFCSTEVWPPPGMAERLCKKCFPTVPVAAALGLNEDAIEEAE